MNNGKTEWRGSFPSVVTPFTTSGDIDENAFVANIELLISEGVGGVVVAGSTGESWALTPDEKIRLFKLAVAAVARRVTVIAGVGDIVTSRVIGMAEGAKGAGADGIVVVPPFYADVSRRGIVGHFQSVSDAVAMPIMVYNIPADNGVNVDAEFASELAAIENVVAIKESSKDFIQITHIVETVGDRLDIFAGHSAIYGFPLVMLGCVGCGGSLEQQVLGREGISIYQLGVEGNVLAGRVAQNRAHQLFRGFRAIEGSGPSKIKAAMRLLGRPSGLVRQPLIDLNKAEIDQVRDVLLDLNLPVQN